MENYRLKYLLGLIVCVMIILTSCDVLEQPAEDFIELDQYFQDENEAIAAVNAISDEAWDTKIGSLSQHGHRSSDEVTNPTYWVNERQREINEYRMDGSNIEVERHWRQHYRYIVMANLVITRVANMTPDQISQEVKDWVMGEAYVWRADSYFKLVTLFGNIPIILTDNMEGLEIEVPESPVEDVYALIISDLEEAERLLPAEFTGSDRGRPIETTATAYLSRVYMQQRNWEKGAEYAKKVIDSGRHWLYDDFKHAFSPLFENGPEHIWSFQIARQPIGRGSNNAWFFAAPRGSNVLEDFRGGLASYVPTIEAFNVFEEDDYRREVSFMTEYVDNDGNTIQWQNFDAPVPHIYKFNDRTLSWEENQDVNRPLIRYSDILLLYAEAMNELGLTDQGLPYLNMVRERARNGDPNAAPQDYPMGMSQNDFRDAVHLERRLELVFEGHRVRDLLRWGTLVESIRALSDPADGAPNPADYIQEHHILWPKPTTQIELNPLLNQNPGYD
ncbi:MAG: RagB/SusD family nutrient uptake outer membrane protein [Balneolaceae bacterium]